MTERSMTEGGGKPRWVPLILRGLLSDKGGREEADFGGVE